MVFLFFNWVVAAALFAILVWRSRSRKGIAGIVVGSGMQIAAFVLYQSERQRLAGQPDLMYVWIVPTLICAMSVPVLLSGLLLNLLSTRPLRSLTSESTQTTESTG